jgi:hypothetical protein
MSASRKGAKSSAETRAKVSRSLLGNKRRLGRKSADTLKMNILNDVTA